MSHFYVRHLLPCTARGVPARYHLKHRQQSVWTRQRQRRCRAADPVVVPAAGRARALRRNVSDPGQKGRERSRPSFSRRYFVAFLTALRALPAVCCVFPFSICASPLRSDDTLPRLRPVVLFALPTTSFALPLTRCVFSPMGTSSVGWAWGTCLRSRTSRNAPAAKIRRW